VKAQALGGTEATHLSDAEASSASPETANELNGLAIFWALLRSWLGSLFGKKPAS
jgi:hypothetical protein